MYINLKFHRAHLFLLLLLFLPNAALCSQNLSLTFEENQWLSQHEEIVVANETDWPPFDFAEGAVPRGYSIDLIKLVAEKTGLRLRFINGFTWEELLSKFKKHEIDILPAVFKTEERSKWMEFTRSYAHNPSILIVEQGNTDITSLDFLNRKKVAVIPEYATALAIESRFPGIKRVPVNNPYEGVMAVATGKVDAFVESLGVVTHIARHNYITNIKNVGEVAIKKKEETALHMGVLKGNDTLLKIIQKGLESVTKEEKDHLFQTWFPAGSLESSNQVQSWSVTEGSLELFIIIPPLLLILFLVGYLFMFKRLRLNMMLTLIFIFITTVAITITSTIAYQTAKRSLEKESFNKLTAVREMKANQIENYFQYISDQILTFSEDEMVVEAMKSFREGFLEIENELTYSAKELEQQQAQLAGYYQDEFLKRLSPNIQENVSIEDYIPASNRSRLLQQIYISENQYKTGYKVNLVDAGDGSSYSESHSKYHPIIRNYLDRFGYYDLFLVEPETGHIVYSVFKEVDFGTSLINGPYKDTNFAAVFRTTNEAKVTESWRIADYKPYHPSYSAPASFIASPIFDGDTKIGVLVFQMPIDKINEIMTNDHAWSKVGLGSSGETYLVGHDYLLRNQSRFLIEDTVNYLKMIRDIGVPGDVIDKIQNLNTTIGLQPVRTVGTEDAMAGNTRSRIFHDYRGVEVLSAYKPLHLDGLQWAIMSEIDKDEAFAQVYFLRDVVTLCYFIIIILVVIIVYYVSRHITRPINQLKNYANDLASHDFSSSSRVDSATNELDSISASKNEVGELARAFLYMETELDQSVKNLIQTTAVKERMEGELNIGRDIQMSMLPLIFPAFPDRGEIDVYASLLPAREVGGDFYDFYFIDENRFCFCVGDVSGKGVPAALFMAITKTLIKSRASEDISTSSIITRVNDELSSDNPASMFVTLFIGILNIDTGEVVYTNAGHNPPYIKRTNGNVDKIDQRHGLVLGAMDGMTYGEDKVFLAENDTFFLYTDGVTEAMDPNEHLYSENRLESFLAEESDSKPQPLVMTVMDSVKDFESTADQADDITILAVRFTHTPTSSSKCLLELSAQNEFVEIDRINDEFSAYADENNLPAPFIAKIKMVFDELLNNTISYAFQDEEKHEIEIAVELSEGRLTINFSDDGSPFNPFTTETPDTELSVEDRGIGGLGVHLVKNIMDEVHYMRKADRNIVTVIKQIEDK